MASFYLPIFLILQAFLNIECISNFKSRGYTPLKINEIACTAEKLKSNGGRYTCDHEGNVHCADGWKDENPRDDSNRCAVPNCEAECNHGMCTSPNYCACEVGWDGTCCDVCIPMPGCVNGACRKEVINGLDEEIAQTCDCERFAFEHALTNETFKYTGRFCDQPVCVPTCENGGICMKSGSTNMTHLGTDDEGMCACPAGFTHGSEDSHSCSECLALPGCENGGCCRMDPNDPISALVPGTCCCDEGYSGPLCNQLQCKSSGGDIIDCGEHGRCEANITSSNAANPAANGCVCEVGWQGENCEYCVPYWNCPNENYNDLLSADGLACLLPNECWCKDGGVAHDDADFGHLCNNPDINGDATNPNL